MTQRRDMTKVALGVLVVAFGTNVSTPLLASYRDRLDLGPNQTQLIFVVYVLGILAMLLVGGQFSDHFGRRAVVLPAVVLAGAGSGLLILGRDSFALLLAGRVLLGAGSGGALSVGAAWIQELAGRGNELRAALVTTLVTYAGFGLGPPLAMVWDAWLPRPLIWPFATHVLISLAVLPMLWRCRETVDTEAARLAGLADGGRWRPEVRVGVPAQARRRFWIALAPLAVLVFAFPSTAFALFPILAADSFSGSVVLLAGVAGLIASWSALLARPLLARVSTDAGLIYGAAIGSLGYVLGSGAWLLGWWPLAWLAAACLGAASGVLSTAGLAQVGAITDDANRGALSSTFFLLAYLGMTMPLAVTGAASVVGIGAALAGLCAFATAVTASTPWRRQRAAA